MNSTRTHYGIVGMGSIGSVFAVLLKQAGHRVSVLEKVPGRVEFLRRNPLKISGELSGQGGPFEITSSVSEFVKTNPDVILVCTKSTDSQNLLREIRDCEPKDTTVFVACQNGLDVEEHIFEYFGSMRGLRMVLNLGVGPVSEGEVQVIFSFVHYLSLKDTVGDMAQRVHDDLNGSGIRVKLVREYRKEAFKKAILNSAMGGVCGVTGLRMKEAMEHPEASWIIKEMVREAIGVAEAMNLGVGNDYYDEAVSYLAKGGNHKPSMLIDIETKRRTENEYHCGKLFRLGKENGVKTPVIQTIYYLIRRLETQALGN